MVRIEEAACAADWTVRACAGGIRAHRSRPPPRRPFLMDPVAPLPQQAVWKPLPWFSARSHPQGSNLSVAPDRNTVLGAFSGGSGALLFLVEFGT